MQQNLKIIPLGGLGEVGRNMMLLEYDKAILIIDMGFGFPEENMPGIDFTIPNISYLKGKEKNILGIIFTHGHYDHIGAIPYLIEHIGNPIMYTGAITQAIITKRQDDFPSLPKLNIQQVKNDSKIKLGPFNVEFFRQTHTIPDNLGLFIETPIGNILHTSDFKFDQHPMNESPTDFKKLEEFSKRKILLLMSDSTSAEEKGHSFSEKEIAENLEQIFKKAEGRIIAATFSSLINRIQQIILLSEKYGRKVIIEGRSMKTNVEISKMLGYIKTKKETLIEAKNINNYSDSRITILCTGAQGEGQAVLMRVANQEHRFINLKRGDTVIFSSSVIPGNERTVQALKDAILRQGAKVLHYKMMDIHASGHAREDELKKMIEIIKPKFFIPIHGQYSMMVAHANLAHQAGIPEKNIFIAENGQIINLNSNKVFIEKNIIPSDYVMVDGLGVGDIKEIVLRDRNMLSRDGMFVIIVIIDRQTGKIKNSPDIISRGFVYLKESKELLKETRKKIINIINHIARSSKTLNLIYLKDELRSKIGQFLYTKTKRRPMILPVIIEI
jgi:ribonuclease J